jgi:hypothetical protein
MSERNEITSETEKQNKTQTEGKKNTCEETVKAESENAESRERRLRI